MGTHSGSPGYQHYPQQQHQEPFNKYQQSSGIYQQPPLPGPGMVLGAGGAGMAYSSQTQVSGTPATGSSSQLAGSSGSGVVFSVGEGGTDRNNLGASSSSNSVASASAMSATNYHSGGRPTATPRVRS